MFGTRTLTLDFPRKYYSVEMENCGKEKKGDCRSGEDRVGDGRVRRHGWGMGTRSHMYKLEKRGLREISPALDASRVRFTSCGRAISITG